MAVQQKSAKSIVMLNIDQVAERIGLKRTSIYNKLDPKSPGFDQSFPIQHKVGGRAVRWVESEIEAWLVSCISTNGVPVETGHQAGKFNDEQIAALPILEKNLIQTDDMERKRIAIVRALLEKHAKLGERVFYEQVMIPTMLSPDLPDDCQVIDNILADISRTSHAENKGLLSVLVHEKRAGKSRPREIFFDLAKSLGYTYANPDYFVEQQIIQLYELYEDPAHKSKGQLTRMQVRGRTILIRR